MTYHMLLKYLSKETYENSTYYSISVQIDKQHNVRPREKQNCFKLSS